MTAHYPPTVMQVPADSQKCSQPSRGARRLAACLSICLYIFMLHGIPAWGQVAAIGPDAHWPLPVWRDASLLRDDSGELTLQQVAGLPARAEPGDAESGFHPIGTEKLHSPDMHTAWWLQLSLANRQNQTQRLRLVLSPYNFRQIDIYLQKPQGAWQHLHGGLASPLRHTALRSRLPSAALVLAPGESIRILTRVVTTQPHLIKPMLYTNDGYITHEVHMRGWDSLLFGGLLALGWSALMIALFSRSPAFLLLAIEAVLVAGYEAVRRGYGHLYLWPDSTQWSYRSLYVLGSLSLAVFLLFVLEVARQEKVRLPGRRWLIAFTVFELGMAVMGWVGNTIWCGRLPYLQRLYSRRAWCCSWWPWRAGASRRAG